MRLVSLIVVLLLASSPAWAAAPCGEEPVLQSKELKKLISSSAKSYANSRSSDNAILSALVENSKRFAKLFPKSDQQAVGEYYFYRICKAMVKVRDGKTIVTPQAREKLLFVSKAFGNPPKARATLVRLAAAAPKPGAPSSFGKTVVKQADKPVVNIEQSKPKKKALEETRTKTALQDRGEEALSAPTPKSNQVTALEAPSAEVGAAETTEQEEVAAKPVMRKKRQTARKARRFRQFDESASDSDCSEFGVIGSDECVDYDKVLSNLKEVELNYNHPKTMYLDRKTLISLVLNTTKKDVKDEFIGHVGEIREGKTKISRFMQAQLSGQDFKITPEGPQRRTVTSIAPVKWTWFVVPLAEGEGKTLSLDLHAILLQGDRELPPVAIKTFHTDIKVDVQWWDLALKRIAAFDPVYQLATAIGGAVTALLFIWRLVVWARRRDDEGTTA